MPDKIECHFTREDDNNAPTASTHDHHVTLLEQEGKGQRRRSATLEDKIRETEAQISEVVHVLHENEHKVKERAHRVDELQHRTDDLRRDSDTLKGKVEDVVEFST